MSLMTSWGYTLTQANSLSDFLTTAEFNAFTNGKFTGDTRIAPNIASATRAIQNYCSWHIYPNLECEMVYNMRDLRDAWTGRDLLVQLPSRFVSSVSSIILNAKKNGDEWEGIATDDYSLDPTGLLKIFDVGCFDRRANVRIVFNSGLSDVMMNALKELVAHRVTHALSSSYGITSESAGGVSVTYNASWAGNTRSTALPDDNKEVLSPFVVKGVF